MIINKNDHEIEIYAISVGGSYGDNFVTPTSDIDLIVISNTTKQFFMSDVHVIMCTIEDVLHRNSGFLWCDNIMYVCCDLLLHWLKKYEQTINRHILTKNLCFRFGTYSPSVSYKIISYWNRMNNTNLFQDMRSSTFNNYEGYYAILNSLRQTIQPLSLQQVNKLCQEFYEVINNARN